MAHNERHEELVAGLAVGTLPGEDRAELERHLAEGCARCEELLADFRGAASALAVAAPEVEPGPELRARVLEAIRPARTARPAPRGAGPSAWRALAAAAALLLVAVGLDDARLRRQREDLQSRTAELGSRLQSAETALAERTLRARVLESDDVQMMTLEGKDPQPQARARVFWSERARRGIIVASNLASLPPDRQYELWVFQSGRPINAGVFDVDPQGRALFESTDFPEPQAQNFAVTVEPRGGMPAPTGPVVLVGAPSA